MPGFKLRSTRSCGCVAVTSAHRRDVAVRVLLAWIGLARIVRADARAVCVATRESMVGCV